MEVKKIFKAGNSLVVSLGTKQKRWMGISEGDHVLLQNASNHSVIIKKVTNRLTEIKEEELN